MEKVTLHDKTFRLLYSYEELCEAVEKCAEKISADYNDKEPLFISVLNGSFMFTAELMKRINVPKGEVCFIKVSSYQDMESTGTVSHLIGLNRSIVGRDIVIVEDMVDSGCSMYNLVNKFKEDGARSIGIASMFIKPNALKYPITVNYVGKELENDFVVGFGSDYNEYGRQLPDLYVLDEN